LSWLLDLRVEFSYPRLYLDSLTFKTSGEKTSLLVGEANSQLNYYF
jgi:hypothetical protein